MWVPLVSAMIFIAAIYFLIASKIKKAKPEPVVDPKPEPIPKKSQPAPTGPSYKKLKQKVAKKSFGVGDDPKDTEAYLYAVKATLVDFDTIDLQDPSLKLVVYAENNQVTAVLVSETAKVCSASVKLPYKLQSVTISKPM